MQKCEIENTNSDYTELTTVAELTPDDGDPRLKTTTPRRS
jgi:hypothetical protein